MKLSIIVCKKRGERACLKGCYRVKGPVHLWGLVYIMACQRLHGNLSVLKKVLSFQKRNPHGGLKDHLGRYLY